MHVVEYRTFNIAEQPYASRIWTVDPQIAYTMAIAHKCAPEGVVGHVAYWQPSRRPVALPGLGVHVDIGIQREIGVWGELGIGAPVVSDVAKLFEIVAARY